MAGYSRRALALVGRPSVDLALDGEQGIDASDRFEGDRR
jgi:hypothetical protein